MHPQAHLHIHTLYAYTQHTLTHIDFVIRKYIIILKTS